jgi:hypothetical protein
MAGVRAGGQATRRFDLQAGTARITLRARAPRLYSPRHVYGGSRTGALICGPAGRQYAQNRLHKPRHDLRLGLDRLLYLN